MDLLQIYECFCDRTRLRILHLLSFGPLCVCHFQEILGEPQVKISKHLGYLKSRGLVLATRNANWMIYSLPESPTPELRKNIVCLQECAKADSVLRGDARNLEKVGGKLRESSPICCSEKKKTTRKVLSK